MCNCKKSSPPSPSPRAPGELEAPSKASAADWEGPSRLGLLDLLGERSWRLVGVVSNSPKTDEVLLALALVLGTIVSRVWQ